VSLLACPIYDTHDPNANPYLHGFAVTLLVLLGAYWLWCIAKPQPRPALRWLAGASASIAVILTLFSYETLLDKRERADVMLVVMEACWLLAFCLVLETALSPRAKVLARAVARLRLVPANRRKRGCDCQLCADLFQRHGRRVEHGGHLIRSRD
jgi:hypothetical protein